VYRSVTREEEQEKVFEKLPTLTRKVRRTTFFGNPCRNEAPFQGRRTKNMPLNASQ
jgi:hypothetical protein